MKKNPKQTGNNTWRGNSRTDNRVVENDSRTRKWNGESKKRSGEGRNCRNAGLNKKTEKNREGDNINKMKRKLVKIGIWSFPALAQVFILRSTAVATTPPPGPCAPDLPGSPVFRKIRRRRKKKFRRLRILGEEQENLKNYPVEEESEGQEQRGKKRRKKRRTWIDDF